MKIKQSGFREYDARWLYEKDINNLALPSLIKKILNFLKKDENVNT